MRDAYDPHGAAVLDCFRGSTDTVLICHQDGARDDVPAAFWLREAIDVLEARALDLCRGRVLDVGAGTGLHTLALQRRGLDVTAIDISPDCVTVMRERGVHDAREADLYEFSDVSFDTIISLCNGLDKVGHLGDLPRFLDRMRELIAPDGQLIADSFDLRVDADATSRAVMARKMAAGRYFGEMDLQFEYQGRRGAPFSVLQVDFDTLAQFASKQGWSCEKHGERGGHYLARLVLRR